METYHTAFEWSPLPERSSYPRFDVFAPPETVSIERNTLQDALEHPIGTKPLRTLIRKRQPRQVLILVDDDTRPTPQKEILPVVLTMFKDAGVASKNITIMIAVGLHRPMSREEIIRRFGTEVASSYTIVNHDAFDSSLLVTIGKCSDGTPIRVNNIVGRSDFIMTIGQISPHRVVGFSGGAKMIQPGICGEETTASIHWRGWTTPSEKQLAVKDNPIRQEIVEIGNRVNLDFIINVIMDDTGVIRYYCGRHDEAFRTACNDIIENYTLDIPESEIVIADGAPYDFDIWQAAKGASVAELVLKKSGTVILLASCPDGWSMHKEEIFEIGYLPATEIIELVETGKLNTFIGCHCMAFARILETGRIIVVSRHLEKKDVEQMNLLYGDNLETAIDIALRYHPSAETITVLKQAGKIIPNKIEEEERYDDY